MRNFGLQCIKTVYESKGYEWTRFNIFGIRAVKNGESVTNRFTDAIGFAQYDRRQNQWIYEQFSATTVAGLHYFLMPKRVEGTAILKEGYYPACYALGYFKGLYEALIQVAPMMFYRDANRDGKFDLKGEVEQSIIGAHIHRAHSVETVKNVGAYSAACQVIANPDEYSRLIKACKYQSLTANQTRFSYALFNVDDADRVFESLRGKKPTAEPKADVIVAYAKPEKSELKKASAEK